MLNETFHAGAQGRDGGTGGGMENPEKSPVFSKYPKFLKNHHALHFVCDTLRMAVTGGVTPLKWTR